MAQVMDSLSCVIITPETLVISLVQRIAAKGIEYESDLSNQ